MNIVNTTRSYTGIAAAFVFALGASFAGPLAASAQETTNGTTMPAIYNSSGIEVNASNDAALAPGYYYLSPGAQISSEIYYNGNGTFLNETTGLYGGSVSDPSGTAGVTLVYGSMEGTVIGFPNTGAGGNAATVWMTLIVTGILAVSGAAYFMTRKPSAVAL